MSLPRSATSSPGRSPAPMPNTTIASAEERFAGSRWAAATAASSARSAGEYGAGALAPGNGVARCPGGPCTASASRYSADRYVPRVERRPARQAGHAERLDHVIVQQELPAGRDPPGISEPGQPPQRRGGHRLPPRARRTASLRWRELAHSCPLAAASPGSSLNVYV